MTVFSFRRSSCFLVPLRTRFSCATESWAFGLCGRKASSCRFLRGKRTPASWRGCHCGADEHPSLPTAAPRPRTAQTRSGEDASLHRLLLHSVEKSEVVDDSGRSLYPGSRYVVCKYVELPYSSTASELSVNGIFIVWRSRVYWRSHYESWFIYTVRVI